ARDERIEELRRKYLKKAEQVKDRIQRAQDALDREKGQRTHAALGVVVDIGTTLLGSLLGGSSRSRSTSATRGASRAWQETQDVQRAEARVEDYEKELAVLEDELRHEIDEVQSTADVSQEKLQRLSVAPKKKDIHPELVALAWLPYERLGNGQLQAAWI
ncbi:MAG: hypothetical protein KDK78_06390, partial [Chlamydiia bacterium]|nr:hypothetical protein [Chlamydiia bacterium]